jgi:hypothetical protein
MAFALGVNSGIAAQQAPAGVTSTLTPFTWATLSDGGGNPIDGVVDWVEVRSRVVGGFSWTSPEVFRGVYEFNLGSSGFTTVDANLHLRVVELGREPANPISFQLYGYTGDGQITAADYAAGTLVSAFTVSSLGTIDVDVSAFMSSAFLRGDQYVGFNIRPSGGPSFNDTYFIFASPTYGQPSSTLMIAQVPEPSTIALAVIGAGLFSRRFFRARVRPQH